MLTMFNNIEETEEININMRCIEMHTIAILKMRGWTININMRCIEIRIDNKYDPCEEMININMRCIEMSINNSHLYNPPRD